MERRDYRVCTRNSIICKRKFQLLPLDVPQAKAQKAKLEFRSQELEHAYGRRKLASNRLLADSNSSSHRRMNHSILRKAAGPFCNS